MEALVCLGAASAYGYSLVNFWMGSWHLYFDTASMLITLVLLGKFLESKAKRNVRRDLENFLALQPSVEKTAVELYKSDPELMTRYLTDYSVSNGEMVVERWKQLGEDLICKYNDGYVKDESGRPKGVGYPESWLREVVKSRPDQFLIPVEEDIPESKLVD